MIRFRPSLPRLIAGLLMVAVVLIVLWLSGRAPW